MMSLTSYAVSALVAARAFAGSGTDYKENGADWGLKDKLCASGKEQSPINLTRGSSDISDKMEVRGIDYRDIDAGDLKAESWDSASVTIPYAYDYGAELDITFADGSQSFYEPLQFHFHSPSEHTVDGKNYDLEVHFVHYIKGSSDNGSPLLGAVVGVFFDTGDDTPNAFIESLWDSIDSAQCVGETRPAWEKASSSLNIVR